MSRACVGELAVGTVTAVERLADGGAGVAFEVGSA